VPTYDPAGHPRLSEEAQAISPEELAAYADEAEAVFAIAGTAHEGRDAEDLTLAVVRQVNLTVQLEQIGRGAVASESKGDQSVTLARDARTGLAVQVDALAQQIVDRVVARGTAPSLPPPAASGSTRIVFGW